MANFSELINKIFQTKRIVIVGDLVADQFLRGTMARVSREAPVFILRHDETETFGGGAANAAVNVASLDAEAVLIGLVGKDLNGKSLLEKLKESKVNCDFVVSSENFQTTTKVRVLAGQHYAARQQVIRIDYENQTDISAEILGKLKQNLLAAAENADAIIISDYDYGVANSEIFETARKISNEKQIPLLIDSRFRLNEFSGATTATPNQDEVEQILGKDFTDEDCRKLCEKLGFESLLVTCGNKGMLLFEKEKTPLQIEAVGSKEPVDVTGAGDTVIAVYALGLASNLSFEESANLANHAGGIVVMKKGTASVLPEELLASLEKHKNPEHKTQSL
ncbi:MAG TPA: PfkB family carbohydrate kinase [Pyrinomonadaceae bacterium]|nr:PfkB family carbohydrate kinase [Pyrinomonadaceae bacterium]